jgi:hypothetical protein
MKAAERMCCIQVGSLANESSWTGKGTSFIQCARRNPDVMGPLFEAFRTELFETCYRQGMRVLSATDDGDTAAVMMDDGIEHLRPMSVIISTRLSMLSGGICVSGAKARNAT